MNFCKFAGAFRVMCIDDIFGLSFDRLSTCYVNGRKTV